MFEARVSASAPSLMVYTWTSVCFSQPALQSHPSACQRAIMSTYRIIWKKCSLSYHGYTTWAKNNRPGPSPVIPACLFCVFFLLYCLVCTWVTQCTQSRFTASLWVRLCQGWNGGLKGMTRLLRLNKGRNDCWSARERFSLFVQRCI